MNVHLISLMLRASVQLYKNAYTGLSPQVWWLSLVIFINRTGTMVIPFLTVYLMQKGFSLTQAGYVMGAFGAGTVVGGWLGGKLTDRFHFFHVQFWSLLVNGVLFIVLGEMQTLAQIMACAFLLSSLGEAFRPANAAAIAHYSQDHNRTRSYSLNRLAINLGWSLGPAIGGILAGINYKLLFWADGITCMAAAVVLHHFLKPEPQKDRPRPLEKRERSASAYRDKIFLAGMFFNLMVGFCMFQWFSLLPVFFKTEVKLTEFTIGALLAMNGLLIVAIEMILVYRLERRNRLYEYMALGSLLIGLSFLMISFSAGMAVILTSVVVVTFGEMILFPFLNNFWVGRSRPVNRGQYAAVFTIAFALATILAPTLGSQVAAYAGFNTLWIINFAICSLAAGGFMLLKRKKDERIPETDTNPLG